MAKQYPVTPDGHYFVVRGRLWRCTNPALSAADKEAHTKALMEARREVGLARDDPPRRAEARKQVQIAKEALGERGPVWWTQGPVCDRKLVKNTSYHAWFEALDASEDEDKIA
jgi:hypothetical protein